MGTENETLGFVPAGIRPTRPSGSSGMGRNKLANPGARTNASGSAMNAPVGQTFEAGQNASSAAMNNPVGSPIVSKVPPSPVGVGPDPATSQISPSLMADQEELGRQAVDQAQMENTLLRARVQRTINPTRGRRRGGIKGASYSNSWGDVSTGGTGPLDAPRDLAAETRGSSEFAARVAQDWKHRGEVQQQNLAKVQSRIGRPPAAISATPPPTVTTVPSATRNGQDGSAVIIAGAGAKGFGFTPTTPPTAQPAIAKSAPATAVQPSAVHPATVPPAAPAPDIAAMSQDAAARVSGAGLQPAAAPRPLAIAAPASSPPIPSAPLPWRPPSLSQTFAKRGLSGIIPKVAQVGIQSQRGMLALGSNLINGAVNTGANLIARGEVIKQRANQEAIGAVPRVAAAGVRVIAGQEGIDAVKANARRVMPQRVAQVAVKPQPNPLFAQR